jgi:Na+/melibiose symporter-like transporter
MAARTMFDEQAARDRAMTDELRDLRRKAIVSGLAGVIAMFVSMPLMSGHATNAGARAARVAAWALLFLALGVMSRAAAILHQRPAAIRPSASTRRQHSSPR